MNHPWLFFLPFVLLIFHAWRVLTPLRITWPQILSIFFFYLYVHYVALVKVSPFSMEEGWWLFVLESIIFCGVRRQTFMQDCKNAVASLFADKVQLAIMGVLVIPGAYIELPSDVYAHFYQISQILHDEIEVVAGGFYYTLLAGPSYFLNQKSVLGAVAYNHLVWTCLFVSAYISFFDELFGDRKWAHFTVVGAISFWGTDCFSYFKYYVFAPAFLGYLLIFGGLSFFLQFYRSQRYVYLIPPFILLYPLAHIHRQEAYFLIIWFAALFSYYLFTRYSIRRAVIGFVTCTALLGIVLFLVYNKKGIYDLTAQQLVETGRFWKIAGINSVSILLPKIHSYELRILRTVGFIGLLLIFISSIGFFMPEIRKRFGLVIFLFIFPFWLYFVPGVAQLILTFSYPEVLYRLSYMVHYWVVLPVMWYAPRQIPSLEPFCRPLRILVVLIFVASLFSQKPIHGKWLHVLNLVDSSLTHTRYEELINRLNQLSPGRFLSDGLTTSVIQATTPHRAPVNNRFIYNLKISQTWSDCTTLMDWFKKEKVDFLILNFEESSSISLIARIARHWPKEVFARKQYYSDDFIGKLRQLQDTKIETIGLYQIVFGLQNAHCTIDPGVTAQ